MASKKESKGVLNSVSQTNKEFVRTFSNCMLIVLIDLSSYSDYLKAFLKEIS